MALLNFIDGIVREFGEDARAKNNREFQSLEAEKNREFQREMYDRQLDDSIAWRTHQEQYNSPAAQMQRYRDAGINPMYAVTGNGGNMVTTPMSISGGYGSVTPSGSKATSTTAMTDKLVGSQVEANEALSHKYNAEANEASARAEGIKSENVGRDLEAQVNNVLRNFYFAGGNKAAFEGESYAELKARTLAEAEEYHNMYQGLSFKDAKDAFMTSKVVREFERSLPEIQRKMYEYELSQADSAAEIMRVNAEWAKANQIINATTELLGAGVGAFAAFKGTKYMPTMSRSYSESYGDHTSHSYNHNYNYSYRR